MPVIINQIKITSVSAKHSSDGKYDVTLTWMINGSSAVSSPGDYTICLMNLEGEIERKIAEGADNKATVTFEKITGDDDYFVKVCAPQEAGGVESNHERLITDYYKNISGNYDGRTLSLAWEADKVTIPSGNCTVIADNGYSCIYTIYPGSERAEFDGVCFREGRVLTASAYSFSSVSQGPLSETLTFYTAPPFIKDVEINDKDGGTDITVQFTSTHENIETVSLLFSANGEVVYETKPIPVSSVKEEKVYSVPVHVDSSELAGDEIDRCTVSCAYINGNARSLISGPGSAMPLARPTIKAEDIQEGKTVMRISYPKNVAAHGFEKTDGSMIYEGTYTVDPSAGAAAVRPRFDRNGAKRCGASSNSASGFIQGYYLSSDGKMIYRNKGFAETEVTHTWNEELFKTPSAEPIISGAISLKCENGQYTLTLETANTQKLSIKDYDGFINAIKDNVTPGGFFALNDAILRMSPQALEDTQYLFCAYNPKTRLSDIRPGMRLTANTAVYMPQYNPDIDNAQGFVSTNNTSWNFIFDSDSGYLEPDLFIGRIAKYMDQGSLNTATRVTYASGIADFMSLSFRQPYYRILFPSSLKPSVDTEDPFLSDNTVVMAAESYGAILDACNTIADNPANINQLKVPLMVFRGRSALSLSIPVQINGNLCFVPVGCNVSQALEMNGYGCRSSVKMTREDDNRIPRPVFTNEGANLGKTALISGDRLEV